MSESQRDPSKTFANPYIACTTCGVRVYWYDTETGNDPCGHRGYDRPVRETERPWLEWVDYVDAFRSVCPSWGPVDGCECQRIFGEVGHDTPG